MTKLVIDTNILQSANTGRGTQIETKERGDIAREFLEEFLNNDSLDLVITQDIQAEYYKHVNFAETGLAEYGSNWLVNMQRTGRVVRPKRDVRNYSLRSDIRKGSRNPDSVDVMLKDVHLIEAAQALEADKTIAGFDEKCRNAFAEICQTIEELKPIIWVNPAVADEKAIEWLRKGAKPEPSRKLEYYLRKKKQRKRKSPSVEVENENV